MGVVDLTLFSLVVGVLIEVLSFSKIWVFRNME